MKIDIICNDGSPLNLTEKAIFGKDGRLGIGGAELALLTMCAAWQNSGNDVTLYNNPDIGGASCFEQKTIDEFNPQENRDILIIFRSPNPKSIGAKGLRVWWSCDQYTVNNYRAFAPCVDKIVTISRFHSQYFKDMYGIENTIPIDLPVRIQDYKTPTEKSGKRCIFTSVPDRGLMQLRAAWPLIQREVPEASLVITSDWRLWDRHNPDMTQSYRLAYASLSNIIYLGAVNRKELVKEQMRADLYIYPGIYDELFCIACAEAQVAGAYPITSTCGALGSTNMGMIISGNPTSPDFIENFSKKVIEQLNNPKLGENQKRIRELALKRFSPERILREWDEKVFA